MEREKKKYFPVFPISQMESRLLGIKPPKSFLATSLHRSELIPEAVVLSVTVRSICQNRLLEA